MHKYGASCNIDDDIIEYADLIDSYTEDYGCFFKSQTAKRISDILDTLDAASPDWDRTEPHAFYATLGDNFPDSFKVEIESVVLPCKVTPVRAQKQVIEWTHVVLVIVLIAMAIAFLRN